LDAARFVTGVSSPATAAVAPDEPIQKRPDRAEPARRIPVRRRRTEVSRPVPEGGLRDTTTAPEASSSGTASSVRLAGPPDAPQSGMCRPRARRSPWPSRQPLDTRSLGLEADEHHAAALGPLGVADRVAVQVGSRPSVGAGNIGNLESLDLVGRGDVATAPEQLGTFLRQVEGLPGVDPRRTRRA
jgi:hypothetical protein